MSRAGTIPESLGQLRRLWRLSLGRNQLTGEGGRPELRRIQPPRHRPMHPTPFCRGKSRGGSPPQGTDLVNLPPPCSWLLTGSIPTSLGNFSELQGLGLSSNQLSGRLAVIEAAATKSSNATNVPLVLSALSLLHRSTMKSCLNPRVQ